jgi:hypothetical protein
VDVAQKADGQFIAAQARASARRRTARDREAVRAYTDNSALLAHDFSVTVAKCFVATKRLLEAMMKGDSKLMRHFRAAAAATSRMSDNAWKLKIGIGSANLNAALRSVRSPFRRTAAE